MKWRFIPAAVVMVVALFTWASAQDDDTQAPPSQAPESTGEKTEQIQLGVPVHTDESPIVSGQPVHKIIPKYPKEARKAGIEGKGEVKAIIEPSGDVTAVSIVSGDLKLAEEAVDAVRAWKFDPYSQNGKPVKVEQSIVFNFTHNKKQADLEPLPPPALARGVVRNISTGGGVYRVGGGVSPPRVISSPDPEYTKEARKAKYQCVCLVSAIVTEEGNTRNIKVVRAIGKGLDEKAVEAVSKWKFKPGMKDGKPVAVAVQVEVMFHLY